MTAEEIHKSELKLKKDRAFSAKFQFLIGQVFLRVEKNQEAEDEARVQREDSHFSSLFTFDAMGDHQKRQEIAFRHEAYNWLKSHKNDMDASVCKAFDQPKFGLFLLLCFSRLLARTSTSKCSPSW